MRCSIPLFLAFAAIHPSVNAQRTLAIGPSGVCPAPPVTTFEIIPVYYSSYFSAETVIDIFGNGNTVDIHGPTTVITTAIVTVTSLPTTPSSTGFNIQIQGPNAKDKRDVSYIGFSGGSDDHGIAIGSQAQAAVFGIIDSFLVSDGEFVETALGVGFLQFRKTFAPPEDHSIWIANTTSVELTNPAFSVGSGQALFCVASDESIYVELTSEPSFTCTQVTLSAVRGKAVSSWCSRLVY